MEISSNIAINDGYREYPVKHNSKIIATDNNINDSVELSYSDANRLQIIQARIKAQYYNNPENINSIVNAVFSVV